MNQSRLQSLVLFGLTASLPAQAAASTFGHARTQQAAALGRMPSPREVAVADIVNYHRHRLPMPRAGQAVALDLRFGADAVRGGGATILQVGMTTALPGDRSELPPLNLGLVVDCSGSMATADKIGQVRRGLRQLAERLRPDDRIAVVAYSSAAEVLVPSRRFGDGSWLDEALAELRPAGSTNLHAGLMLGLQEVGRALLPHGSNRVLLLTDGIANVGETDPAAILRAAAAYTAEDTDLTTIGVGEDLNTDLLDRLARGGRGLFHFVADGEDLAKVFVQEVEMLLAPIARHVELRLELPRDLIVEEVYGHPWRRDARGDLVVPLPDMNAGLTAVVVLRCRCQRSARRGDELSARAWLRATSAADHRPIEVPAAATQRVADDGGDPLADVQVRKNHTIAVLAQGMHEMAVAAADGRWAAADRAVRTALEQARRRYGHRDDPDVATVMQMAEAHEQTLRRYLDRFRDQE